MRQSITALVCLIHLAAPAFAQISPAPLQSQAIKNVAARASEMTALLTDPKATEVQYLTFFRNACADLRILLAEEGFSTALAYHDKASYQTVAERQAARQALKDFSVGFYRAEAAVMKEAGMTEGSIQYLLKAAENLHDAVSDENKGHKIRASVEWLKNTLCEAKELLQAEVDKDTKLRKMQCYALAFGGGVYIVIDSAATVIPVARGGIGAQAGQMYYSASSNIGMRMIDSCKKP